MPHAHDPQAPRADDADHRPGAAGGPGVREDLARFHENPDQFADAFARAWFKLTHRDMGPWCALPRPEVPAEELIWQDPIPAVNHKLIDAKDIAALKAQSSRPAVRVGAGVDRLGVGVDLPWLRHARRRERCAYSPRAAEGLGGQPAAQLAKVLEVLEGIQSDFNKAQTGGKKVSLADLIVLAGCAGVEQAAKKAGHAVTVPFAPGRMDASQEQTDVESFAVLEPVADGFRNYLEGKYSVSPRVADRPGAAPDADRAGNDRADRRHARPGYERPAAHGVFTKRPETLTNDFFVNLLDMGTEWKAAGRQGRVRGRDRKTGALKWTARASTSSSVRTPSSAPSRRSTAALTRRRSLSRTSSPRGPR